MVKLESTGEFSEDECDTLDYESSGGQATVNCDCSMPGEIGVFLVASDGEVILQVPEVFSFERSMTFK